MDSLSEQRSSKRYRLRPGVTANLPGEIINEILNVILLDGSPGPTVYQYCTLEEDGAILVSHQTMVPVDVDESGTAAYCQQSVLKSQHLAELALTLTLPKALFVMRSGTGIAKFIGDLQDCSLYLPDSPPACNVEIPILHKFQSDSTFTTWVLREREHGKTENVRDYVESWLQSLRDLPDNATIFLVFQCFWFNYRPLRALCRRYETEKKRIHCRFEGSCVGFPRYDFHVLQTLAAVHDTDMIGKVEYDEMESKDLVEHGCRGFHIGHLKRVV